MIRLRHTVFDYSTRDSTQKSSRDGPHDGPHDRLAVSEASVITNWQLRVMIITNIAGDVCARKSSCDRLVVSEASVIRLRNIPIGTARPYHHKVLVGS